MRSMNNPGGAFNPFGKEGGAPGLNSEAGASTSSDGFASTYQRGDGNRSNSGNNSVFDLSMDTSLNTSIDSSAFRFPASYSNDFPVDPMGFDFGGGHSDPDGVHGDAPWKSSGKKSMDGEIPVDVTLHEEMTCRFDGVSNTSSLSVIGKIRVKSNDLIAGTSFDLVIDDAEYHVASYDVDNSWVTDTTNQYSNLEKGERVLRIRMPGEDEMTTKAQVASYACCKTLRRIPILVQSKIRNAGQFCRVGVKIRANPSNESILTNVAVIMAVPPDINGETVKLSKRGAIWDPMKRIIVWPVQPIKGGESVEVQAQFEVEEEKSSTAATEENATPTFPVIVRCEAFDDQLSSIKLGITDTENVSSAYKMNLMRSYRVLHRKI